MAYKADVHDIRESPSLEVLRQLRQRGGEVRYCDPWVHEVELDGADPPQRGVVAPRRCAPPTASSCSPPHREFLETAALGPGAS